MTSQEDTMPDTRTDEEVADAAEANAERWAGALALMAQGPPCEDPDCCGDDHA